MSIARTFYKQICRKFFDAQILSAKAFLAQIAVQALFNRHRCKKVTPSIKCLPSEHKKTIPAPKCMAQSPGMPFYYSDKTNNICKRISYSENMSGAITNNDQNTFINFNSNDRELEGFSKFLLQLEGERMKISDPDIEIIYRDAKQLIEHKPYLKSVPNFGKSCTNCYAVAAEKLLKIDFPPRDSTQMFLCGGLSTLECDKIYEISENICGGRFFNAYMRPDTADASDIPIGLYDLFVIYPDKPVELKGIGARNKNFLARTINIGKFLGQNPVNLGVSGAFLRAADVKWDIEKMQPNDALGQFEYDILEGIIGDNYDSTCRRIEKMRKYIGIIDQPVPENYKKIDDHKISPTKRCEMNISVKELIHDFNDSTSGLLLPPGKTQTANKFTKSEFVVYVMSYKTVRP